MRLINCKIEFKLRRTKHFVLSVLGNKNNNANGDSNNIIFTMNDTILYAPVVTSSGKDNQKFPKFLSKRFERVVYWN